MMQFLFVSGLPASGKSTLGAALARELGLPLLDKDAILEKLFARRGIGDLRWRARLSREADAELERRCRSSSGAVIVSWWRHPGAARAST